MPALKKHLAILMLCSFLPTVATKNKKHTFASKLAMYYEILNNSVPMITEDDWLFKNDTEQVQSGEDRFIFANPLTSARWLTPKNIAGTTTKNIWVLNKDTKECLMRLKSPKDCIRATLLHNKNLMLCCTGFCDKALLKVDLEKQECKEVPAYIEENTRFGDIKVSPDGSTAAVSFGHYDAGVLIWDIKLDTIIKTLDFHTDEVDISWTNANELYIASKEKCMYRYKPGMDEAEKLDAPGDFAIWKAQVRPDGEKILFSCGPSLIDTDEDNEAEVEKETFSCFIGTADRDLKTIKQVKQDVWPHTIAWKDNEEAILDNRDFDVKTKRYQHKVLTYHAKDETLSELTHFPTGMDTIVTKVIYSPDKKRVLIPSSYGVALDCNIATKKNTKLWAHDWITAAEYDENNTSMLIGTISGESCIPGKLYIYDVEDKTSDCLIS